MKLTEKEIARESIFQGHLIDLEKRTILLPNGETAFREVVRHPPAAAAVVVNDKKELLLVKQWREPIKKLTLEIPAGMVDETDSTPQTAMQRELNEEAGLKADYWEQIAELNTSPGFTDEKIYLFYCDTLSKTEHKKELDKDEFLNSLWYNLATLRDLIARHEIIDAKTLYAISVWQNMLLTQKK